MLVSILLALVSASPAVKSSTAGASLLVDVARLDPRFLFDIRYATHDNFFNTKVYPDARCVIRKEVGAKLVAAQAWLDQHHHGLRLLFKDCYRPNHVQFVLWDAVKGTPKAGYVADPNTRAGSMHSHAAAVDLTLADAAGKELDMGTPYDYLGRLAEPRHEKALLAAKKLTPEAVENRRVLREAMTQGGHMQAIPNEWWHFDDAPKAVVMKRYPKLDVPFSAVP